jgi:hypothetical protein
MVVPFRTFALFSLAFGMLAAGYLLAPAPGATQLPPPPVPVVAPAPKTASALVASRPPVPIVTQHRASYSTPIDHPSSDKATADKGTSDGTPPDPAKPQTAALATDQPSGNDAQARHAIEFDGYKNVRAVTKDADGVWHARAMRGRTEIAVRVDASGNVSAE